MTLSLLRSIQLPTAVNPVFPLSLQFPARGPQDFDDYVIDCTAWMADAQDTIANATIAVIGDSVTISSIALSATQVVFWASGGTAGVTCAVVATITTAGGRTIQRSFGLPCAALYFQIPATATDDTLVTTFGFNG